MPLTQGAALGCYVMPFQGGREKKYRSCLTSDISSVFDKEMHVEIQVMELAPEQIDCSGPWLFWKEPPTPELEASLERCGQLVPVLVREGENGPELIDGLKRVTALARLGRPVSARFVDGDVDPGVLYCAANTAGGGFVGESRGVSAWRYFQAAGMSFDSAANLLGTAPRSRQWKQVVQWAELEPVWDRLLADGHVALAHGPLLARMSGEDRETLVALFEKLSWSRNNGQNLLTWLWELGRSRKESVAQVMDSLKIPDLAGQELSPKDRIARILEVVRRARYPHLTEMERAFRSRSREVTAGTRWQVRPGDVFETGGVELSVRVKNREEMDRAVEDLERMQRDRVWETIWPSNQ